LLVWQMHIKRKIIF